MAGKQRSTAFNIGSTLITKFILLFGGFIISVILARILGPEGKGMIAAVFVLPSLIVSLADMGIRQSTAYYVGKKIYNISDIISSIAFLWLITSLASVGIVFIYHYFEMSNRYPWIILLVALASIPIQLIAQYARGIMLGKNQISTINLSQLIRLISNFLSVFLLVWLFDMGVLGAALVQLIIASTVAIYYLVKVSDYHSIRFKPVPPIPKLLFLKGFSFAATLFIINLNYKIDIMILDYLVSPAEIGVYSIGVDFGELLWQIPSAIGMVLFAKSATTEKQSDSVERSTTILRIVLPIMLVTAALVATFAPLVIRVLYGPEFIEAGNVLRILLPGICLITISKILHPDLAARGYPLFALRVFTITLVINVILNFMLIPYYSIYRAAIASTISYILAGIGFAFVYSKKENIPLKELFVLKKSDIIRIKEIMFKRFNR